IRPTPPPPGRTGRPAVRGTGGRAASDPGELRRAVRAVRGYPLKAGEHARVSTECVSADRPGRAGRRRGCRMQPGRPSAETDGSDTEVAADDPPHRRSRPGAHAPPRARIPGGALRPPAATRAGPHRRPEAG